MNRRFGRVLTATALGMLLTAEALALEPIPDKLVVLTFDDASRSHLTVAVPLLKKHGFGATFFVSEGFDFPTNKRDYLTWDEIAQLHRDGYEIGNHTRDHKPPSVQDPQGTIEQLEAINARCLAHGIPRPVSFAYPGNALDKDVLHILHRLGIKFARRGGSPEYPYDKGRGFAYQPGLDHPLLIPSAGDARPGWTLDDFKRAVSQAKGGKIAVVQLHGVPDTAHSWVSTPAPLFESYVKYLADNGYRVVALRELARYVDPAVVPSNPWRVIEDRKGLLASGRDGANALPAGPHADRRGESAEVRYLGFQVFTQSREPPMPIGDSGLRPLSSLPAQPEFDAFVQDVIRRIGTVGEGQAQLAVIFGPLAFDHGDAEIRRFVEMAFALALERKVAVGFHLDDSMFWARRDDLWRGPENVEWTDWNGTPNTGRRIDWGPQPAKLAPQMCFNSKSIQQEVRRRAVEVFGKAIHAGIDGLQRQGKERLFAGVIAGWETHIGRDFDTGRSLGYHALVNRGLSSTHPPRDMDVEREKVVDEFITLWTQGLADGGVPANKIYSHLGSIPKRMFEGNHPPTLSYSQANGFAPPWVAFGKSHRAGFSTYPQPGLFEQIYEELARRGHPAWATCEGTNFQLGTGPGQSGMNMETYLAKSFNHGATLVNLFGWVVGDEAKENEGFRLATGGEEALRAYRKFLRGQQLVEAVSEASSPVERPMPAQRPTNPAGPAQMLETGLGPQFIVFRGKVQEDLEVSDEQKRKLQERMESAVKEMMESFQSFGRLEPEERAKEMGSYRQKAEEKQMAFLRETLTEGQLKRMRQLTLQREGLFTLGHPEMMAELRFTDQQKHQFMTLIREMQEAMEPVIKEAQSGGRPEEIGPRLMKIRRQFVGKIETILTDAQKRQWKEMLGKPLDLGN